MFFFYFIKASMNATRHPVSVKTNVPSPTEATLTGVYETLPKYHSYGLSPLFKCTKHLPQTGHWQKIPRGDTRVVILDQVRLQWNWTVSLSTRFCNVVLNQLEVLFKILPKSIKVSFWFCFGLIESFKVPYIL